jgi:hypothetical protein
VVALEGAELRELDLVQAQLAGRLVRLVPVVLVLLPLGLDLLERQARLGGPAGLLVEVDLLRQRGEERVLPAVEQLAHGLAPLERAAEVAVHGHEQGARERRRGGDG